MYLKYPSGHWQYRIPSKVKSIGMSIERNKQRTLFIFAIIHHNLETTIFMYIHVYIDECTTYESGRTSADRASVVELASPSSRFQSPSSASAPVEIASRDRALGEE